MSYSNPRGMSRAFYIPSVHTHVKPEGVNMDVYFYDPGFGRYAAMIFIGRASKPSKNMYFSTAEHREEYVQKIVDNVKANEAAKKARAAQAKLAKAKAAESVKVGDIFSSSWGYDQTNVDFYKCVAKRGQMIDVVKVGHTLDHCERGSDYVVPDVDCPLGGKMTKRINQYGGFRVESYANAYPFDGEPQYQTAAGYGH